MSGLSLSGSGLTITGGGGSSGITVGTTTITGGTTGKVLYDNGGVVGETTLPGIGLWSPAVSAVPTFANTGFDTWYYQGGAAIGENAAGISMGGPSSSGDYSAVGYGKAKLATPYKARFLIGITNALSVTTGGALVGAGFWDGASKKLLWINTFAAGSYVRVDYWDSQDYFDPQNANVYSSAAVQFHYPTWVGLEDDGTNFVFSISQDGVNFGPAYTVAKASSGLSGGYTHFGMITYQNGNSALTKTTLMGYYEG